MDLKSKSYFYLYFRYVLDNPKEVENLSVLDVGCGSGATAIAAAHSEAKEVLANDVDIGKLELDFTEKFTSCWEFLNDNFSRLLYCNSTKC